MQRRSPSQREFAVEAQGDRGPVEGQHRIHFNHQQRKVGVDVPELLSVLDFRPLPVPYLMPQSPAAGVTVFRPVDADFALLVIEVDAVLPLDGPAIALCLDGEFTLGGASTLHRGGAVYISDESSLDVRGAGSLVIATS